MRRRNKYAHIVEYTPTQDKQLRANAIQQRMRVGAVRYDCEASWYEEHKHELRTFPRGKKKDRVDAIAWLGRHINELVEAPSEEDIAEDEYQWMYANADVDTSRDEITGY